MARTARMAGLLAVSLVASSCGRPGNISRLTPAWFSLAMTAGWTSPGVYSADVRVAPGFSVGDGDATVHPTVGFARSLFGGVDGEQDNYLFLGTQVRSGPVAESGVWLGGEAIYARRWTSFDSPGIDTETTNGWTLAAMAGIPVGSMLGAYIAAGVNKYGGSGPYVRLGFEIGR